MDTTELHYINYDAESTWDEMLRAYIEAGGDILYPGDEKEMLLRAVLAITVSTMAKVDNALRMATRRYATGEYLKLYGENRDVEYMEAVAATAPVTLTFGYTGTSRTLEKGTEMTADGTMIYKLTEAVAVTGTAQTINTSIVCAQAGSMGNGLQSGTQMQFIQPVYGLTSAIVTANASGGIDAEDEEEYRERIGARTPSTAGPAGQYEALARAASPLVVDAKALNNGDGAVGVYLILASGADSAAVISAVNAVLTPEDTRPLNDQVTVAASPTVAYVLNVKATFPSGSNGPNGISAAAAAYQAWQEETIGRAFDPYNLISRLYNLGATRVEILNTSEIAGESAEYTAIASHKHCAGTVDVTVVTS